MNIFVLDDDPYVCARMHADTHTVKMILETAQLLSTAVKFYEPNTEGLYKSCYVNHPCARWLRSSRDNFTWLAQLGMELADEFHYRYGNFHKSVYTIIEASSMARVIPSGYLTPFAQAMPDEFKTNDAVAAYRNYYKFGKSHLMKYTKRAPPKWVGQKVMFRTSKDEEYELLS